MNVYKNRHTLNKTNRYIDRWGTWMDYTPYLKCVYLKRTTTLLVNLFSIIFIRWQCN